jgi:peptidoglycan-associated lipoprotein
LTGLYIYNLLAYAMGDRRKRGTFLYEELNITINRGGIMKMKVFGLLILLLVSGLILGGCGCFQQQMRGEQAPPKAAEAKIMAPEAKPTIPVTQGPGAGGMAPVSVVHLKDINFDFDKYNIREKDAAILKGNVAWFRANAGKTVRIEGNCDERGTVEYNLALGQKRADSTKGFLINLGVNGKSMQTVSYGKEKPICQEHNEECWAKNRRAHFAPIQ